MFWVKNSTQKTIWNLFLSEKFKKEFKKNFKNRKFRKVSQFPCMMADFSSEWKSGPSFHTGRCPRFHVKGTGIQMRQKLCCIPHEYLIIFQRWGALSRVPLWFRYSQRCLLLFPHYSFIILEVSIPILMTFFFSSVHRS